MIEAFKAAGNRLVLQNVGPERKKIIYFTV